MTNAAAACRCHVLYACSSLGLTDSLTGSLQQTWSSPEFLCLRQEPVLELMHRHLDAKGKQAKLKSPQELQDLLDVTRELLASMENRPASKSTSASSLQNQKSLEKPGDKGDSKKDARPLNRSMTNAGAVGSSVGGLLVCPGGKGCVEDCQVLPHPKHGSNQLPVMRLLRFNAPCAKRLLRCG